MPGCTNVQVGSAQRRDVERVRATGRGLRTRRLGVELQ